MKKKRPSHREEHHDRDADLDSCITPQSLLELLPDIEGVAPYEVAVTQGWVVCLPQQISLRGVDSSSVDFVQSHLLQPYFPDSTSFPDDLAGASSPSLDSSAEA